MPATYTVELEKLATRKKASSPGVAKRLLQEPGACALALIVAAKDIAGPDWHTWEPEALWLTLEGHGVDVPVENRVKMLAALTLRYVPSFYWDGVVFEKTALAFDGHDVNPDILEEATTAQLAWAVVEAEQVIRHFGDSPRPFEHEPGAYAAVVMHREGLVFAPDELAFAQDLLDSQNCKDTPEGQECPSEPLRVVTKKAWAALNKESLATHAFSEDPLGVQLAHLASVALHVQERKARAAADLAALRAER